MARDNKDMADNFLSLADQQLNSLLQSVTNLSKEIAPTTLLNDNYIPYISELIKIANDKGQVIHFIATPGNLVLRGHNALMLFRIMQELIQLAEYIGPESTLLKLHKGKQYFITSEFARAAITNTEEVDMYLANIANRVEMLNGSFSVERKENEPAQQDITIQIILLF